MNHCVAVRTYGSHVRDRVYFVLAAYFREGNEVVNVDEPLGKWPIHRGEVELADGTRCPIVRDARCTGLWIALVGIHVHSAESALGKCRCGGHLIWEYRSRCTSGLGLS